MALNFTFVIFTMSFIIFLGIMKLVFFDKLKKVITNREKLIESNLEAAKLAAKQANDEFRSSNFGDILSKARVEAQEIISQAIELASTKKQGLLDESHQQVQSKISNEVKAIKKEQDELMSSLDGQVQEIVKFTLDKFYTELGDKETVAA